MKNIFSKGILLAGMVMLTACNPFKVTDPSDPRFDVTKFSFEDYRIEKDLHDALGAVFPSGTNRKVIEDILIDNAGLLSGYTEGRDRKSVV